MLNVVDELPLLLTADETASRSTSSHTRSRRTFCSHLAMRGAPGEAIQELAGHQDLATTQRYMHLSPAAPDSAIRLLESSGMPRSFGDMLETADR